MDGEMKSKKKVEVVVVSAVDRHHPVSAPGFSTDNYALGVLIGRMRYDKILDVLEGLKFEIDSQAKKDHERKRYQLSGHLTLLTGEIMKVIISLERIFKLCKPYLLHEMRSKKADTKQTP